MSAERLIVQEVAPRDGLQIEPQFLPTAEKIWLVDAASAAGFSQIEVSSFVSPKAIPMLRDAEAVFAGIARRKGTTYVALAPNLRGAERALAAGADELNLVMSASETHNRANMRMSTAQSLAGFAEIAARVATAPVSVNASVATAFGCPFEGPQPPARVLGIVEQYLALGANGISLADTTGMANPRQVGELVRAALRLVTPAQLTLHFHNTRGMGLANVLAAYEAGARRFDAALAGLGGCPFAPGASGNICSEDLVNMCAEMGIPTGIDLRALLAASRRLTTLLAHDTPGQVAKAGLNEDLHPATAALS
jgi:hydroxymethylglutaryl-CoA lyase